MRYILVIDSGTSHTRAMLFDLQGQIQHLAEHAITACYPKPNWVEQCPLEIWDKTLRAIREVCQAVDTKNIISCAITNQRETMVLWNKRTGKVISKAIVWQDRRSQRICDELKSEELWVQEKTGLKIDPYFSASKLKHFIEQQQITDFTDILFGTIDTFLLWHLTAGHCHATDVTNASRTLLFNIHDQMWDDELLKLFNVPKSILPRVLDCDGQFGNLAAFIIGESIPIRGVIGDQQASLVGVGALRWGQAKITYGTGGFLMANTGSQYCNSQQGLLSTIGYTLRGQTAYALEGNIYDAGASLVWLKDHLNLIDDYEQIAILAQSVSSTGGVYFIPSFSGLGAPHWLTTTGAAFVGMSRDTHKAHLVRAVLESIAYQTRDILTVMNHEIGQKIFDLVVDGGVAHNQWLIKFLANLNQIQIQIPNTFENTAKGAAWIAGQAIDAVDDIQTWQHVKTIDYQHNDSSLEACYQGWLNIIHVQKRQYDEN